MRRGFGRRAPRVGRGLLAALASLALTACAADPATTDAPSGPDDERAAVFTARVAQIEASALAVERVWPALEFRRPVAIVALPGSADYFVVEQAGRVLYLDGAAATTNIALDMQDEVLSDGNEQGLLNLALHPNFPDLPFAFVYYTADDPDRGVLARLTLDATAPTRFEPDTRVTFLEVEQPFSNHNGGGLAFGPDGRLYLGLGDGGSAGDPNGHAQSLRDLLGTIVRLDIDFPGPTTRYSVPADNPFVGRDGARGEIFAYGLRNPWRIDFDPASGRLWVGDVGQSEVEEVDWVQTGRNYGWNVVEGERCFLSDRCDPTAFAAPVTWYSHDLGQSITGGPVYRGTALPALAGTVLYADYVSGRIWTLVYDGERATSPLLLETGLNLSSFGRDHAGEPLLVDHDATGAPTGIWRLRAGTAGGG